MKIYEINTRVHCSHFEQITDSELTYLKELGFEAIWLMGVWKISKAAIAISKIYADDFEGSPYALPDYKINPKLGGKKAFMELVSRAHAVGLKVLVDFVSNHMAIDCAWIKSHPEFFLRSNPKVRKQNTGDFFYHKSGEVFAFGRDPYFPPWHDTAQLDYTNPKLRAYLIKTLKRISRMADGIRCDMAMLVLRDYFRQQWYPLASDDWFEARFPQEFWGEAIHAVKSENPEFIFIAESYWDKEPALLELGFDVAYEKKLYDALVDRNAALVTTRLVRDIDALHKSVYFIENHDEERAAGLFDHHYNLAVAALILALPGSALIHEGQMEGRRERLPVQRLRPLTDETDDFALKSAYHQILRATCHEAFAKGDFQLFNSDIYGVVSFSRTLEDRTVIYLGQISDAWHQLNSVPLNLTAAAKLHHPQNEIKVTNLLNSHSKYLQPHNGHFHVLLSELAVEDGTRFALLEIADVDTSPVESSENVQEGIKIEEADFIHHLLKAVRMRHISRLAII
ncbi:MAG: alpha-amylase family glycosyl hydrolase [Acidobacteriota bacterium]